MSTSSNESFVVVSAESQDEDGNRVTRILKPSVTFEDVLDNYPVEQDLLVRVTYDESHREKPEDRIVLVPVGWKSIEDAFSVGEKCNDIVKFSLKELGLPHSGETCQLCYYTDENKCVLGLSKPFKLEHYSKERLMEFIEHEKCVAPSNKLETHKTTDSQSELTTSGGESEQVVQQIPTEMKEWLREKENLLNEIEELKESVAELKNKVEDSSDSDSSDSECSLSTSRIKDIPVVYGITATYRRVEQLALLTRLSHTLRLIPCFHWIVVEDGESGSLDVHNMLMKSGLSFTHLFAPSPVFERRNPDDMEFVEQRNAALRWLRNNKKDDTGIVYFMDEFKIYGLEIFNEMRSIQRVGVWPVGLAGGLLAEQPIVDKRAGCVIGWNSQWRRDRRFPIDAIGCAINLKWLMVNPEAMFSLQVEPALRLSSFLSKLVSSLDELEPKADNCTKVFVWYIQIKSANVSKERN